MKSTKRLYDETYGDLEWYYLNLSYSYNTTSRDKINYIVNEKENTNIERGVRKDSEKRN